MTSAPKTEERGPLRLPKTRRYTLYFIAIGVFLTGALWLIYHYFMQTEGRFGLQKHPLEIWWLKTHGAFSFASLWMFGVLWSVHIVRGWNMRWRRWSGGTMVGVILFLTLTGYGLYYFEELALREWTSILHWAVGLAALVLFFIHWLSKSAPHLREHGAYPWPWFRKRHPTEGK